SLATRHHEGKRGGRSVCRGIQEGEQGHSFPARAQLARHLEGNRGSQTPAADTVRADRLNPAYFRDVMGRHVLQSKVWGMSSIDAKGLQTVQRPIRPEVTPQVMEIEHIATLPVDAEER